MTQEQTIKIITLKTGETITVYKVTMNGKTFWITIPEREENEPCIK